MDLFDKLNAKVEAIASAARELLAAEYASRKIGIPGRGRWAGFDSNDNPTVKIGGRTIIVNLVGNTIPPLNASVYVDESLNVDYKVIDPRKTTPKIEPNTTEVKAQKRPRKRKVPPFFPDIIPLATGATWLVYPEYLNELEVTTASGSATNPEGFEYSLFLQLAPALALLGGGVLLAVLWTQLEQSLSTFSIYFGDLPSPQDRDGIPSGLSGDDYVDLILFQGVLDQALIGTALFFGTDGLYAGIGGAFNTTYANILINGEDLGPRFSEISVVRPHLHQDASLLAILYMFSISTPFTGGKIQAAIIRANKIYLPKKLVLNVHAWPATPGGKMVEGNSLTYPGQIHKQIVIPDDIGEFLLRDGAGRVQGEPLPHQEIYPYSLVPLHKFQTLRDDVDELDITKFASFDGASVFLHYVLVAHAPWTNLGDTYRTNFYNLNIQCTFNNEDDENPSIDVNYVFEDATFSVPNYFRLFGDIIEELPQFPIQAGDRNQVVREITYTINGTNDIGTSTLSTQIVAIRGEPEKTGFIPFFDKESDFLEFDENNNVSYFDHRAPYFRLVNPQTLAEVPKDSIPGFVFNERTGQFVFDQNVGYYANMASGSSQSIGASLVIVDGEHSVYSAIEFIVIATDSTYVAFDPEVPGADVIELEATDPVVGNEWDPDPFEESAVSDSLQQFDPVITTIPFPEVTTDGSNVFGYAGIDFDFQIKDVPPPRVTMLIGETTINADPTYVSPDDFEFSVETSQAAFERPNGFKCSFTPKDKNYDFLHANETLQITYTLTANVNAAPFVGNLEDLSDYQRKIIRAGAIYQSSQNDWRHYIPNDVTREGPFFHTLDAEVDHATRDEDTAPVNISISTGAVTSNFIHEFTLSDSSVMRPALALATNNQLRVTQDLTYDFDEDQRKLIFYSDEAKTEPLTNEQVIEYLENNGQTINVSDYFVGDILLPAGDDRNDTTGNKWRRDPSNSQPGYGYIIYGYLPNS